MDWLEQKYIGMLSSRLRNYKRKSDRLYNFSCPVCGDSSSNQKKARGYIYEKKGRSIFFCHNCSATMSVPNLIKYLDQNLYGQYVMEKLKGGVDPKFTAMQSFVGKMKRPEFIKTTPLNRLKKVSQLPHDHPAKVLVDSRKIPTPYHAKLFYCPNFMRFTNELVPGKFSDESLRMDEGRLLIPFIDSSGKMHAYQGRALGKSDIKYITIVLDEDVPKVYGLDTVDLNKTTYVMEGPIDSTFISNSIATAGGDLVSALAPLQQHKASMVVVYDNEPRSKETVKKMDKAVMQGYRVCVWPENLEHKDVNDMVMAGLTPEFIRYIIDNHTYRDLAAKMALTKWSRA